MSALFDFRSFLTVLLLTICTCTYVKMRAPQVRACALQLRSGCAAPCCPCAAVRLRCSLPLRRGV
jgi:hypothetical protein